MKLKTIYIRTRSGVAIILMLAYALFIVIPVLVVSNLFPLRIKLSIIAPVWSFFSFMALKYALLAKVNIIDRRDNLEKQQTVASSLYIANHLSFIDIPLMGTTIQLPPIMKKEVLYVPIFGIIGWLGGSLILDRSKGSSRKKIFLKAKNRILKDRVGLQLYPEGTRSRDGKPKPFKEIKRAILTFAYQENIPIYPVSIHGTNKIKNKKNIFNPDVKLTIIFHSKINPKEYDQSIDFEQACWEKVVSGFKEAENLNG